MYRQMITAPYLNRPSGPICVATNDTLIRVSKKFFQIALTSGLFTGKTWVSTNKLYNFTCINQDMNSQEFERFLHEFLRYKSISRLGRYAKFWISVGEIKSLKLHDIIYEAYFTERMRYSTIIEQYAIWYHERHFKELFDCEILPTETIICERKEGT